MTASTTVRPSSRAAVLDRATATRLAATEYDRFDGAAARRSGPHDWARPTDCPDWDVRAMAGHVLGMAEMVGDGPLARRAERRRRPGPVAASTP